MPQLSAGPLAGARGLLMEEIPDKEALKILMISSFNAGLDERINRAERAKVHNIIPYHYFSNVSAESKDLFIGGHYYGCISLCQTVAESLSRFICSVNKTRNTKDYNTRVNRLYAAKLISSQAKTAFETIWGTDRNTFHHLNIDLVTNYQDLLKRAEECLNGLYTIEAEIFSFKIINDAIAPEKPIYWPKPNDGKMDIFLKPKL
jgi:hypothetical protein